MKNLIKLLVVAAPLAFSINANAADSVSLGDGGVSWLVDSSITTERSNTFGASTVDGAFLDNHIIFSLVAPTTFNVSSTNAGTLFSFLLNGAFANPPGLSTNPFSGILGAGDWQVDVKTVAGLTPNATIDFGGVTAAVPEPETYALMLAGLALVGFSARRRQA